MSGLERFLAAQDSLFDRALAEIASGQKRSHWMWFIFPQLRCLGKSDRAMYYGLADLDETGAFFADPVLGPRLVKISACLLNQSNRDALQVFGEVDAAKLRSCMTLFAALPETDPVFRRVLEIFFGNDECPLTAAAVANA